MANWLDKYDGGGELDPFGLTTIKKDVTTVKPGFIGIRPETLQRQALEKEIARRQTYIGPRGKSATPAMKQAAEDRIAKEKTNAFTKKIAEGAQTIGGALELAAPFTGPFMPIVGGVGAGLGIGSSAYLAGKDAMAGNYGSAALNAGFGALDLAGFAALRNPAVKDFVQGADHVSDYSQVVDLTGIPENIKKAVPQPWQMQELPGLHLKSTMVDGPVSKIVEPKTGLVNVEQALGIIGKESGGAEKLALIKQGLGENLPKKMDYNEFRKTVQDQLIPLERQFATHASGYGLPRIGYHAQGTAPKYSQSYLNEQIDKLNATLKSLERGEIKMPDSDVSILKNKLSDYQQHLSGKSFPEYIENQTLILSNKGKFGRGSSAHDNPEETLGHAHFLRDVESPDVLTVTQIQSDAFQGPYRIIPKATDKMTPLEQRQFSFDRLQQSQERNKTVLNKMKTEGVDEAGVPVDNNQIKQFEDIVKQQEQATAMSKADLENFSQKQLLDKSHQERYLQELVDYAGGRGDINKMRVPTPETAAKVQNYTPSRSWNVNFPENGDKIVLNDGAVGKVTDDTFINAITVTTNDGRKVHVDMSGAGYGDSKTPPIKSINDVELKEYTGYDPEHQTILKKYAEQPKTIKKLFGEEPKIVTDGKGNTWYEFDIPKKFKEGKGEIKALKNGGWLEKYNDGGPVQENYNDYSVTVPPNYEGEGYFNEGRDYSPAWGGQFQMGGSIGGATQGIPGATGFMYSRDSGSTPSNGKYAKKTMASAQDGGNLSFIDNPKLRNMLEGYKPGLMDSVGDYRLPEGYMAGSIDPSTEVSMSIGVAPSYLIPSFKYGQPLQDPVQEFNMTGQHLGGPFKTVEDAETFRELRHQYVEKGQPLPSPIATANMTIDPDLVERGQYRSSKAIKKVDPNSTYDPLDTEVLLYDNNRAKITKKDVEGVKNNMINYLNSPLYRQRLNNYPENYRGDEGSYQKKKFENAIANAKVKERTKQLRTVPYDIKDGGNRFNQYFNKVNLNPINSLSTIAHELGHAGTHQAMPSMRDFAAESDYSSGRYWDSITNKTKLNPFSIGLNEKEIEELVDRAKPLAKDTLYEGDPHNDKNTMSINFAQESYGDLMGAREILYKKGYTKNFGDPIDKKLLDKAMKDKSISEDFIFRRFYEKYGADNVIHLNNTIAANNPQQGMPMAQNGMEMKYYQDGLDFKPKSISKNGKKVIKDDMGQWAHPGEITEIDSNQITMQGVPYPVLGISDTGDTQMMYPNQEYEFIGDSVTEYPMMKQGGQLTKLDQLTNFTNYNTKQPGGWLDKYQ
jgi:hypothetical protein